MLIIFLSHSCSSKVIRTPYLGDAFNLEQNILFPIEIPLPLVSSLTQTVSRFLQCHLLAFRVSLCLKIIVYTHWKYAERLALQVLADHVTSTHLILVRKALPRLYNLLLYCMQWVLRPSRATSSLSTIYVCTQCLPDFRPPLRHPSFCTICPN